MIKRLSALAILGALLAVACGTKPESDATAGGKGATVAAAGLAVFAPLPSRREVKGEPGNEQKIALGRALFYETLLSDGHNVSCNSCHALNGFGADGRKASLGFNGRPGGRNAPTVYNAAGHVAQFWDGRAADVEAQAKGPILNPVEMGMPDTAAVLKHLRASATYAASFRAAFPEAREPVTYDNLGSAIGAFERGLVTPARWDSYLQGDSAALTGGEKEGLQTFLAAGCQGCHMGAYVGGDRFMKAGLVNAWFSQADSGRIAVTKDANDLFVFKVPSLRNIEKTGPYFHDGSVANLGEAVRLMAHHQLGKEMNPADVQSIVTWLGSMTGELPLSYIAFPQKPK